MAEDSKQAIAACYAPDRAVRRGPQEHEAEPPQEARLTTALRRRLGAHVTVRLTDNRRNMLSARARGPKLEVRAHHMFVHAGPDVLDAVARYLARGDADASAHLSAFIDAHGSLIRRAPRGRALPRALGEYHDLRNIFDELNAHHFGGRIEAAIGWGRRPAAQKSRGRRRPRRSIRLGSYDPNRKLIRVHPALDAAWVPRFFVRYVVFHEMLHHEHQGAANPGGRRLMHSPCFRTAEESYPDYGRAKAWEQENLHRLLR